MRVLLINPPYPQTFWSFNRVLQMLNKKALTTPLGLLTVAALLPREWELRLADMALGPIPEQDWNWCETVMISGMLAQHAGLVESIREAKKRAKTVVVGGPWVFHFPQDALAEGADIVVRGEVETGMTQLLEALDAGRSGVVIEDLERPTLGETPCPRFDLLDKDRYIHMAVQFSRGCPFHCDFCDITTMFGRRVRTKSSEAVLAELDAIYATGWRRGVFFVDDNFIGHVSRAKELLEALIPWMERRGYPFEFFTQCSVNLAARQDLLDMMVRAGFNKVFLGIETPDEESLKNTGKHQNVGLDLNEVCRKINTAGLQIIAGCIIGFDGEIAGAGKRLIAFAERNNIPEAFATLLQVAPGTTLFDRMTKEGRVIDDETQGSQTSLLNFEPTRPMEEIVAEFVELYDVLYEPGNYLTRAFRHVRNMKPPKIGKRFSFPYLFELRAVAIATFRQGVVYPSRFLFWRYLLTTLFLFPSKLPLFYSYCIMEEHFSEFRHTVMRELTSKLSIYSETRVTEEPEALSSQVSAPAP